MGLQFMQMASIEFDLMLDYRLKIAMYCDSESLVKAKHPYCGFGLLES